MEIQILVLTFLCIHLGTMLIWLSLIAIQKKPISLLAEVVVTIPFYSTALLLVQANLIRVFVVKRLKHTRF